MIGETIGKYRVDSPLGRGGMGTVYKAVDLTLDREVAIKCLHADHTDPDVLKRFKAEALTLARLNHPNIATLYELTEHGGQLLMVMEFVRGETLEAMSERLGPLPIARAAQICAQSLDALAQAHRAGIVHRDLKPANLMVNEAGLAKVMDFGIARIAGTEHLTNDGYMMGTPAYMAPEQVLGTEVDGRADLYAMGVVFYRLLTANLPFKAETGIAMVHKHLHDAPTPARQFRENLPDACQAILDRALAKVPAERFQTAEEFKAALLAAADLATASERVPTVVMPQPAVAAVAPRPATGSARSRALAGAGIALVLLVGAPATWFLARYSAPGPASSAAASTPASQPAPTATVPPPTTSASVVPVSRDAATGKSPSGPAVTASDPPVARGHDVAQPTAPTGTHAESTPARKALPAVTFAPLKYAQFENGRGSDRDASLRLDADAMEVLDGAKRITRIPYRSVVGLFYAHAWEPRWQKGDGTVVSLGKMGGRFGFIRTAPDWITLQTRAQQFIPLRVGESDVHRIVQAIEERTGLKVVRVR